MTVPMMWGPYEDGDTLDQYAWDYYSTTVNAAGQVTSSYVQYDDGSSLGF